MINPEYNFALISKELKQEYDRFKSKLEKYINFMDWACLFSQAVDTKQLTLDLQYIQENFNSISILEAKNGHSGA